MKKGLSVAGALCVIGLLVLTSLFLLTGSHPGVHASDQGTQFLLPKSPLSGGALMAQAVHSGKVHPHSAALGNGTSQLVCSPVPCVLPNVRASEGGKPVNEDPIVVNPTNGLHLLTAGNDYNCPNIQGFYSSGNGGTTWSTHCMANLPGQFGEGDPGVGYDRHGNSYITGIDSPNGRTGEIIFQKSSNNGMTWTAPAVAVPPLFHGGLTDKDWLQIDTSPSSPRVNSLYISVTQFSVSSNSEISVSHSHDGGAIWTTVPVDKVQIFPKSVDQFSDLAIGRDGTVYVSWMRCTPNGPTGDCGGTTATLLVSRSTDGGATWSHPVTIARVHLALDTCNAFYGCLPNTSERVSEIPAIDIDRSTGRFAGSLYVIMYNWTGNFMQVQVATSRDGGATWKKPVLVAPAREFHDQFFPWLTVSEDGLVGVTWLDRRHDPGNVLYEAFAAVSMNGGTSFGKNVQIATKPSDPINDGFDGAFMGDYTGNYWFDETLYTSWMDSRNGVNMQDEVGGYRLDD